MNKETSQKAKNMVRLFKKCKLKHKQGCFAESCEECIDRFDKLESDEDIRRCRVCGCTDDHACPGGCWWVEDDLCSECVGKINRRKP